MKRVTVRIEKIGRDFSYDFDNLAPRDDVMTKLYSQNMQFKKQVELGQLDEMTDFHITWQDLDEMGQVITYDAVLPVRETKAGKTKDAGDTQADAG